MQKYMMGGSTGLMVIVGDASSRGHELESLHLN